MTQTATPYLIQAVLNGSPAVAIAGTTANPIYSLIAKPQIKDFADLKGKLIGLSLPVDTISISMRKLLALKGLGDADYRVKELVGTPLRAACLKPGSAMPSRSASPTISSRSRMAIVGSAFRPRPSRHSSSR